MQKEKLILRTSGFLVSKKKKLQNDELLYQRVSLKKTNKQTKTKKCFTGSNFQIKQQKPIIFLKKNI